MEARYVSALTAISSACCRAARTSTCAICTELGGDQHGKSLPHCPCPGRRIRRARCAAMSAKAVVGGAITTLITSPTVRDGRRALAGFKRRLSGAPAQVHYFHQTDDPYSHLMLQVLP